MSNNNKIRREVLGFPLIGFSRGLLRGVTGFIPARKSLLGTHPHQTSFPCRRTIPTMNYTVDPATSISYAVIDAVSEYENKPALDLPPLHKAVSPDALDSLFAAGTNQLTGTISFTYSNSHVTIHSNSSQTITVSQEAT